MINRFGAKPCGICHRDIERGEDMTVVPGMSGPRGGKVYSHAACAGMQSNPSAGGKRSPFTRGYFGGQYYYETRPEGRRHEKKLLRKARRRGEAAHIADEMERGEMMPRSERQAAAYPTLLVSFGSKAELDHARSLLENAPGVIAMGEY